VNSRMLTRTPSGLHTTMIRTAAFAAAWPLCSPQPHLRRELPRGLFRLRASWRDRRAHVDCAHRRRKTGVGGTPVAVCLAPSRAPRGSSLRRCGCGCKEARCGESSRPNHGLGTRRCPVNILEFTFFSLWQVVPAKPRPTWANSGLAETRLRSLRSPQTLYKRRSIAEPEYLSQSESNPRSSLCSCDAREALLRCTLS